MLNGVFYKSHFSIAKALSITPTALIKRMHRNTETCKNYNIINTMNIEEQYLNVLKQLVHKAGQTKIKADRTGTGTFSMFGVQLRHDMKLGFPLLTTKKVHFQSVLTELLWFLRGQTDLRTLLKDKNYIWVGDAYKKYRLHQESNNLDILTREEYIEKVLEDDNFANEFADLGKIYGAQWRGTNGANNGIDQLHNVIEELKTNPNSRRLLVDSWNPVDLPEMTLPPCHMMFQFYTEEMSNQEKKRYEGFERKISLHFYMRSWDVFLGGSFNIASYALLLELVAKMTGYLPDELIVTSSDTHLYSNHIDQAKLQLSRKPFPLPTLNLDESTIKFDGTLDEMLESITNHRSQIQLDGYLSHSKIEAPLSN
jgi:thymidylate synthase